MQWSCKLSHGRSSCDASIQSAQTVLALIMTRLGGPEYRPWRGRSTLNVVSLSFASVTLLQSRRTSGPGLKFPGMKWTQWVAQRWGITILDLGKRERVGVITLRYIYSPDAFVHRDLQESVTRDNKWMCIPLKQLQVCSKCYGAVARRASFFVFFSSEKSWIGSSLNH